jgi:cytosine/adenosine deaminase-related metal-dependent hydrolase
LGVAVDVHLDEHLDAPSALIDRLVEGTVKRALQGRVTLSHGCVLSAMRPDDARRLLDRMAEARVMLVGAARAESLPAGAWQRGAARSRVGARHRALRAGVAVRFGTDNVRDWSFPFGDGDMPETGFVGAMASHVDAAEELASAHRGGRRGRPVAGAASSFDDALAQGPGGRVLLRRGMQVGGRPARSAFRPSCVRRRCALNSRSPAASGRGR